MKDIYFYLLKKFTDKKMACELSDYKNMADKELIQEAENLISQFTVSESRIEAILGIIRGRINE